MVKYLEDSTFCDANTTWYGAFASRIRESIADKSILGYLDTSLEAGYKCCKVWDTINITKLNTGDATTARVMFHRGSFLVFHSQSKKLLFKLEKEKSIAITDNIFLRTYFEKVIEVPVLLTEVKKLLKGEHTSYNSIL